VLTEKNNEKIIRNTPIQKWYALYTNPRAEKKVEKELILRGFECYLPLQITMKQWSDRKKKVEIPLFNSYIFVRIELEKSYYKILEIPGIVKFVKFGKEISALRDSQIEQIKLLLSNFEDIEVNSEMIGLNEMVEVIAGPLIGLKGLTIENQSNKSFAIEIEQLGCFMKINLPKQYLSKV
jgi:transcription antitermination factor NusG